MAELATRYDLAVLRNDLDVVRRELETKIDTLLIAAYHPHGGDARRKRRGVGRNHQALRLATEAVGEPIRLVMTGASGS